MIPVRRLLPLIAFFAASPVLAQQANEFDLETTATPAPRVTTGTQVQGPVDDSGIVPVGPRAIGASPSPTPTRTASPAPAPTATPTETRTPVPTVREPATAPSPTRGSPRSAAPRAERTPQLLPPQRQVAPPPPQGAPIPEGRSAIDPIPSSDVSPPGSAPNEAQTGTEGGGIPGLTPQPAGSSEISALAATGGSYLWWVLAALVAAIAAVAGFALYRRRQPLASLGTSGVASPGLMPAATPQPRAAAEPETVPPPAAPLTPPSGPALKTPAAPPFAAGRSVAPLGLETQIVRMQRSMMALTVTARIAITNRGSKAIHEAVLQGDLVGASNKVPLGEQLASAATTLVEIEKLGELQPGERHEVTVNVRASLGTLQGIRQGAALVYVPLLRIRFAGDGVPPLASTVLVGHPAVQPGGKPTPFPAQAPPQIYDNVVGRALG